MTDQSTFMIDCYRFGNTATVTQVTGTACGCVASQGSSREWHRLHPTADDCNGTGLIDTTTTTTSVKSFFTNRLQSLMTFLNQYKKTEIGEIDDADLFIYGVAKALDASYFDISGLKETGDNRANKVTFNSQDYQVRHIYDIPGLDETVIGQVGLLKKI